MANMVVYLKFTGSSGHFPKISMIRKLLGDVYILWARPNRKSSPFQASNMGKQLDWRGGEEEKLVFNAADPSWAALNGDGLISYRGKGFALP